jgi:hypothetical protein
MLDGVEQTARTTLHRIQSILQLMEQTRQQVKGCGSFGTTAAGRADATIVAVRAA